MPIETAQEICFRGWTHIEEVINQLKAVMQAPQQHGLTGVPMIQAHIDGQFDRLLEIIMNEFPIVQGCEVNVLEAFIQGFYDRFFTLLAFFCVPQGVSETDSRYGTMVADRSKRSHERMQNSLKRVLQKTFNNPEMGSEEQKARRRAVEAMQEINSESVANHILHIMDCSRKQISIRTKANPVSLTV